MGFNSRFKGLIKKLDRADINHVGKEARAKRQKTSRLSRGPEQVMMPQTLKAIC